ncbi:hypothetical protein [Paludifilum halophilum]|uniref:hypothetical protein n=1 Tax=Paludifilum halophilum TaxID=1642702 RepID=UPI00146A413E|nr:hypothetical protein [Paludifilum halophilum]
MAKYGDDALALGKKAKGKLDDALSKGKKKACACPKDNKKTKGTGNLKDLMQQKSLGRGSTGRTTPNNLNEQLAMKEVLSDPLKGAKELKSLTMTDSRWPARG